VLVRQAVAKEEALNLSEEQTKSFVESTMFAKSKEERLEAREQEEESK
jgi:hypothetical protein